MYDLIPTTLQNVELIPRDRQSSRVSGTSYVSFIFVGRILMMITTAFVLDTCLRGVHTFCMGSIRRYRSVDGRRSEVLAQVLVTLVADTNFDELRLKFC